MIIARLHLDFHPNTSQNFSSCLPILAMGPTDCQSSKNMKEQEQQQCDTNAMKNYPVFASALDENFAGAIPMRHFVQWSCEKLAEYGFEAKVGS